MYLKRYTVASLLLLIAVGWFIYAFVTQESATLLLFGVELPPSPVALLVVIPMAIMFLASLFHMMYYSIKNYFKHNAYEKDFNKFLEAIYFTILEEKKNFTFSTERYRLLHSVLGSVNIAIKDDAAVEGSEKLNSLVKTFDLLKSGEEVNLKSLGVSGTSRWTELNSKNRLAKKPQIARELLTQANEHSDELRKEAYRVIAKSGELKDIVTFRQWSDLEALSIVFSRSNSEEHHLEISLEEMANLIRSAELNEEELLKFASKLRSALTPEARVALFEKLNDDSDAYMAAYLYTLFDLEMIPQAKEILENSQSDDFLKLKAYAALKDANEHFDIDLIVI